MYLGGLVVEVEEGGGLTLWGGAVPLPLRAQVPRPSVMQAQVEVLGGGRGGGSRTGGGRSVPLFLRLIQGA